MRQRLLTDDDPCSFCYVLRAFYTANEYGVTGSDAWRYVAIYDDACAVPAWRVLTSHAQIRSETIRYDTILYMYIIRAPAKSWSVASLIYSTEPEKKRKIMIRTKTKNQCNSEETSQLCIRAAVLQQFWIQLKFYSLFTVYKNQLGCWRLKK